MLQRTESSVNTWFLNEAIRGGKLNEIIALLAQGLKLSQVDSSLTQSLVACLNLQTLEYALMHVYMREGMESAHEELSMLSGVKDLLVKRDPATMHPDTKELSRYM